MGHWGVLETAWPTGGKAMIRYSIHTIIIPLCYIYHYNIIQVAYGRLATILQLPAGETAAVVLSYCERGETNAQGCKLIEATQHIKLIDPQDIIQTVSIVHNCNSKCILTRRSKRAIEREDVITDKYYSIEHDFTHNIYCVNK